MNLIKAIVKTFCLFTINFTILQAAPSSIFWTNCTTDVIANGVGQIAIDDYFTVFNRRGNGSAFPTDAGFELGIFSWGDFSTEAGIDYYGGTDDPIFFNIGVAAPENKLFCNAPSFKIGFFNAGTRYHGSGQTNQNISDIIVGKTLPESIGGRLFFGGFAGSRAIGKNRQGFMIAYQCFFCADKYCEKTEYFKWMFCADYASGKNTIGGGGFALSYYFTPNINLLTGPIWFNSTKINGSWKWSVQLNLNFSVFDSLSK